MSDKIVLTKQHVIKSELENAILLFFQSADIVPIHVLASAAWEMLQALAKKDGIETMRTQMESIIHPDNLKDFRNALNEPYNFMKHASRVKEQKLDTLTVRYTQFVLFAGVHDYYKVWKQYEPAMMTYRVWWMVNNPGVLKANRLAMMTGANILFAQYGGPLGVIEMLKRNPDILEQLAMQDAASA